MSGSTPIERAKADLIRLKREHSRAEMQVKSLDFQIRRVEAYIEMAPLYESEESQADTTRNRGTGIAATAVRLAIEAIREKGTRIHTRDLLKILQDQGLTVGGSNPVANLSGFLSRAEELHNSRAEGWGLVEWNASGGQQSELDAANEVINAAFRKAAPSSRHRTDTEPEQQPESNPWDDPPTREDHPPPWEHPVSDLDDEIPF